MKSDKSEGGPGKAANTDSSEKIASVDDTRSNVVFVDFASSNTVAGSTTLRDGLDACYGALGLPAGGASPAWDDRPSVPTSEAERRWRAARARRLMSC